MEELIALKESFDKKEWANPTWTDRILSILQDNEIAKDEKNNKYPRVRGLRRIGSYLSEINVVCDVICCNEQYAACRATGYLTGITGNMPVVSSTAEATPANVNNAMIAKHLLATSESRAEGRCWTKILKLNCLTAEEMSVGDEQPEQTVNLDEEDFWFTDVQKKMLNKKCKNMNVNILKYAEFMRTKASLDVKHIDKNNLSKELVSKMIENVDKSTRNEKGSIDFKKESQLQGYESI